MTSRTTKTTKRKRNARANRTPIPPIDGEASTAPTGDQTPTAPPPATPAAEDTTTIHSIPGREEPIVFTGGQALPGFEHLSFQELAQLAGKAGLSLPNGADEALDGVLLRKEIAEAKTLLAEAEERGEGPLDLAHAYGYLDGVHKALGRQVKRTREQAEKMFAAAQLVHGMKALDVMADDGGPAVATIHIQESKPVISWDSDAVESYCREHAQSELYQEVLAGALNLPDVIAYVAMAHPSYVETRVREAYLTRLQSEIDDDGQIPDPTTGELVQLATVTPGRRDGAFIIRYAGAKGGRPSGKERIERMFRAGGMGDILALGAASDAEPGQEVEGG
ncbi:hypothetical protein ACIBEJ_00285 [Nonomuraea sp. NPDC050790]|uniref:hypothetical protein n=1 Tax=Nonomuraea sp. NPDC050790 TaxID=3364371 RepID=UPI0037B246B8